MSRIRPFVSVLRSVAMNGIGTKYQLACIQIPFLSRTNKATIIVVSKLTMLKN